MTLEEAKVFLKANGYKLLNENTDWRHDIASNIDITKGSWKYLAFKDGYQKVFGKPSHKCLVWVPDGLLRHEAIHFAGLQAKKRFGNTIKPHHIMRILPDEIPEKYESWLKDYQASADAQEDIINSIDEEERYPKHYTYDDTNGAAALPISHDDYM